MTTPCLTQFKSALIAVLEKDYDDFKIIWNVFVPEFNIQRLDPNAFVVLLQNKPLHCYDMFVKILMIYHDKYPIKEEILMNLYNEITKYLNLRDIPVFSYTLMSSMSDRYAKEIQAANDAIAARKRSPVTYDNFDHIVERLQTMEDRNQHILSLLKDLQKSVAEKFNNPIIQ